MRGRWSGARYGRVHARVVALRDHTCAYTKTLLLGGLTVVETFDALAARPEGAPPLAHVVVLADFELSVERAAHLVELVPTLVRRVTHLDFRCTPPACLAAALAAPTSRVRRLSLEAPTSPDTLARATRVTAVDVRYRAVDTALVAALPSCVEELSLYLTDAFDFACVPTSVRSLTIERARYATTHALIEYLPYLQRRCKVTFIDCEYIDPAMAHLN